MGYQMNNVKIVMPEHDYIAFLKEAALLLKEQLEWEKKYPDYIAEPILVPKSHKQVKVLSNYFNGENYVLLLYTNVDWFFDDDIGYQEVLKIMKFVNKCKLAENNDATEFYWENKESYDKWFLFGKNAKGYLSKKLNVLIK